MKRLEPFIVGWQQHDTRLAALEAENAALRHELDLLKAA